MVMFMVIKSVTHGYCHILQQITNQIQVQESAKGGMCSSGFHPTSLHPKTGHKVRFKFNENKI